MKAGHIIVGLGEGGDPLGVKMRPYIGCFDTGDHEMQLATARGLMGARLHLHLTQKKPAYLGGKVVKVTDTGLRSGRNIPRVRFTVKLVKDSVGTHWQGDTGKRVKFGGIIVR